MSDKSKKTLTEKPQTAPKTVVKPKEVSEPKSEEKKVILVVSQVKHNGTVFPIGAEWPVDEVDPAVTKYLKKSGILK